MRQLLCAEQRPEEAASVTPAEAGAILLASIDAADSVELRWTIEADESTPEQMMTRQWEIERTAILKDCTAIRAAVAEMLKQSEPVPMFGRAACGIPVTLDLKQFDPTGQSGQNRPPLAVSSLDVTCSEWGTLVFELDYPAPSDTNYELHPRGSAQTAFAEAVLAAMRRAEAAGMVEEFR